MEAVILIKFAVLARNGLQRLKLINERFFSLVPIYKKWFYIQYILGRTTEICNLFEYVKLISGNFSFTNHDIINDVLKFLNEKHFFYHFFPRITIVKLIKPKKKTRKEIYNSLLFKINKILISFHIFDNIPVYTAPENLFHQV